VSRDYAPLDLHWGGVCRKCTGVGFAHYLTCPTLRPPAYLDVPFDDGSGDEDVTP
jgi:hypothetical protein